MSLSLFPSLTAVALLSTLYSQRALPTYSSGPPTTGCNEDLTHYVTQVKIFFTRSPLYYFLRITHSLSFPSFNTIFPGPSKLSLHLFDRSPVLSPCSFQFSVYILSFILASPTSYSFLSCFISLYYTTVHNFRVIFKF